MLRFACSFQAATGTEYATLWTHMGTQPVNNPALSRWGSDAPYVFYGDFQGAGAMITLDEQATWIVNMSWRPYDFTYTKIIDIGKIGEDISPNLMGRHLSISTDTSLRVIVSTGDNLATIIKSTKRVRINQWYTAQIKFTCDSSSGRIIVILDGDTFIDWTGDTRNSSVADICDTIGFAYQVGAGNSFSMYQDIAIFDTQAGLTDDIPNPTRTCIRLPEGVGTYNEGTYHGDSTHAYDVREVPPDGDTTYIEVDTVGTRESYAYTTLPTTATAVLGVQTLTDARRTDVGVRSLEDLMILSGTDYTLTPYIVATSYGYHATLLEYSPATGLAFTLSEVNDSELGYEVPA